MSAASQSQLETPAEFAKALLERKKALLAKVKVARERLLFAGEVNNPNPNKVYIWVNTSSDRQVTFQGMGYTICKDPNITTRWRQEDGTHRRGDLILYEIDRDLDEAIKLDGEMRAVENQDAEQLFLDFARQNRVPAQKLQNE